MAIYHLILSLVALHVLSISAQSTITIIVSVPAPTPSASSSYTSQDDFEHTMLNVTNRFRAEHNANALIWNNSLADTSSKWAKECRWKHSKGPYGENLAMGFQNLTAAVEAWGNEREQYNYDNPGFSEETGHFTQLVWKSTSTVGCGRFDCGTAPRDDGDEDRDARGWYVVCHYWPPGNVMGDHLFQDNVQRPISGDAAGGGVPRLRRGCGMWAVVAMLGAVSGGMLGWA